MNYTDPINEVRKSINEKQRLLAKDCKAVFGKGERMSAMLASFGVEYSPPMCRDMINGKGNPSIIKVFAIRAVIEILDEQRIAEIRARQARVRAL